MLNKIKTRAEEESSKARSAWKRGTFAYVFDFIDYLQEFFSWNEGTQQAEILKDYKKLKSILLNGADNWEEFSYSGNALIYNYDIAKRLCTPSEFKKTKEGYHNPNSREDWCKCQARALTQAFNKLWAICRDI